MRGKITAFHLVGRFECLHKDLFDYLTSCHTTFLAIVTSKSFLLRITEMICNTCSILFTDLRTSIANGDAFKDDFENHKYRVKYHKTKGSLQQSAEKGCKICLGIQKETKDIDELRFEDYIWVDPNLDSSNDIRSLTFHVAGKWHQFNLQKSGTYTRKKL
jgi:hypothetical protein